MYGKSEALHSKLWKYAEKKVETTPSDPNEYVVLVEQSGRCVCVSRQ